MEIAKCGYKSEIDAAKEIGRSERGPEESGGETDRTPQKDANQKFELRGFSAQGTIHKFGKTKGQEERIGRLTVKRDTIKTSEVIVGRSREVVRKRIRADKRTRKTGVGRIGKGAATQVGCKLDSESGFDGLF